MDKLTYTTKETAEKLNLGISKTYELIRQNIIPSIKVGRINLVPKKALHEWLEKSVEVK